MDALAGYIREKREARSLTQKGLGDLAGTTQAAISDIERGQTKLPNADLRRKLAKALGVSHLDLLVAAGEITPDEVQQAGVVGVVEKTDTPKRDFLIERMRNDLEWDHEVDFTMTFTINLLAEKQKQERGGGGS